MKYLSYAGYARQVITTHLERLLLETEKVMLEADNVEAVHQARVASRRLRNAFWVFKDILPEKKLKVWKEMLRGEAAVMGTARDLDVQMAFLNNLGQKIRKKPYRADVARIMCALKEKRAALRDDIMHVAEGMVRSGVLSRIKETIDEIAEGDRRKGRHKLYVLAKDKIWSRITDLLSHEMYVSRPEKSEELHRMRIAAKKLRYTLENFEPLYGKRMARFIEDAHSIQDRLGELHDLDVWMLSFPGLIKDSRGGKKAAGNGRHFTVLCRELRNKVYENFAAFWQKTKAEGEWEDLASFIASFDYGA